MKDGFMRLLDVYAEAFLRTCVRAAGCVDNFGFVRMPADIIHKGKRYRAQIVIEFEESDLKAVGDSKQEGA